MISVCATPPLRQLFRLLLFLSAVLALSDEAVAQPGESSIDFLYINANAGEASGGHTALRLNGAVFHYQFFPDGTFLLVREPWDSFRFLYNELHNRSISIAPLPLDPTVIEKIRNHFTDLLVDQDLFLDKLESLEEEQRINRKILVGGLEFPVACLGFFAKDSIAAAGITLRQEIEGKVGQTLLPKSLAEAEKHVQETFQVVTSGERPGNTLHETLAWREGLRVLSQGRGLDQQALLPPMAGERVLSSSEAAGLRLFAEHLLDSIARLLHSSRPDRGEVLLLLAARYQAVLRSLELGRLVTLDPFGGDTREVQLTDEEVEGEILVNLYSDLQRQAATRRELFFGEIRHPELAYSFLETGRARAWELSQVNDGQRRVRILPKVTLPTRPATVSLGEEEIQRDGDGLSAMAALLEDELDTLRKQREERYGYNLFSRNCATELIRSLNSSFADPRSGKELLGGWLTPDSGLLFIPFIAYEQWITAFPAQGETFLPARRLRHLDRLYAEENDLLVWLRESNTLTSTLYAPRSRDTVFLFFTDDSLLLRPIQGVLNVGYGALHGAAAVVALPFDGGTALQRAARGIFYSLPELTFSNIRKGSYATGGAVD